MKMVKSIVANCATHEVLERKRIHFSIETGLILDIENNISESRDDDYIFDDSCILFPGMGDIHIHAREDLSKKNMYKEDFTSACCAALNGGVVHVADMPNNPVAPIDDLTYSQKVILSSTHEIPFLMYAGIGPNTNPLTFNVPYKAFMGPSIGDLFFKNNDDLDSSIKRYKNLSVSFHCEDPIILENHKNAHDHFNKRPIEAEILATEFALELIGKYNLNGKLCHYSSGRGLDSIIKAKKNGIKVQAEVTPQHLFFNEEMIKANRKSEEIFFQMNPPIRHREDSERLLYALKNGDIDFLATDHAPHSQEEKLKGMSGMPGLDTYSLFVTWLLNEQKIDPIMVARFCSYNPGLFFNQFLPGLALKFPHYNKLGKGFGILDKGFSASFTVLNLKRRHLLTIKDLKSKALWSPFLGHEFSGSLEAVFFSGQTKYNVKK